MYLYYSGYTVNDILVGHVYFYRPVFLGDIIYLNKPFLYLFEVLTI
jgi:hypothetical protein